MTTRGSQSIGWDVENRVMKTENGETILYVNRYYEKNLDTGVATTYYYLGGQLVAMFKCGESITACEHELIHGLTDLKQRIDYMNYRLIKATSNAVRMRIPVTELVQF